MRVGIDCRMLDWVGVGRYTENLLKGLAQVGGDINYTLFCHAKASRQAPETPAFTTRVVRQPVLSMPAQLSWARELNREDLDVFHSPGYMVPLLYRGGHTIITVHDLIPLLFEESAPSRAQQAYFSIQVRAAVKRADRVIAVSRSTKKDLIELLGAPEGKISVIHEAADERYRPVEDPAAIEEVKRRHGVDQPYLLYVGTYLPHKNLPRIVSAFAKLPGDVLDRYQLVLAGKKDKRYPEVGSLVKKLRLKRKVLRVGYVSEEDLPALYSGAEALVFASLFEGFGLPPLEAMACGTPVIASNRSSLPEVLEDAALLVDPTRIQDISEAMARVLTNPALAAELRRKGIERAKRFSWRKTAEETIAVYRSVAGRESAGRWDVG